MPKVSFPCSQIGLDSGSPSSCLELGWTVKWVVTALLAAVINIVDAVGQGADLVFPQPLVFEGLAGSGLANETGVLSALRL